MQELSMHLMDIAQNSVAAGSGLIEITVEVNDAAGRLIMTVRDNGKGMNRETLERVTSPFTTSRTTRKVGLGIPLLKMAAELTGGSLSIESELGVGTSVTAEFTLGHIDLMPLGDLSGTLAGLMQCNPDIDFVCRIKRDGEFVADSRELKRVLDGVPISSPEVALFIREYIEENSKPILKEIS